MSKGLQVETCKGCHEVLLKGAPRCHKCGRPTGQDASVKNRALTGKTEVTMSEELKSERCIWCGFTFKHDERVCPK